MIEFDISKFRVELVHLKYISKSMGGTMSILDTSNKKKGEKFKKLSIPTHVADAFIRMPENLSHYIKPVLTAVCYYGDIIVALQRHPLGNEGKEYYETLFGRKYWESNIADNIKKIIETETRYGNWFIDGAVIYSFTNEPPTDLSSDRKFQALEVDSFRLTDLSKANPELSKRTCIAFMAKNGKTVISPPVWSSMDNVGNRKVEHLGEDEAMSLGIDEHQFDKVDRLLAVNLNFALRASSVLIDHFGYESIEPLRLDDLMVKLRTVNLPKLDKSIKTTYDIGMKFTHAIAWIVGLGDKGTTLESYGAVRSILRYLTSRGIVHKSALAKDNVFQKNMDMTAVPLMNPDDIQKEVKEREKELLEETGVAHKISE